MDTNTVQLIEKFGSKLDQCFSVLAEKAGVATDYFWPLFVQKQQTEGIITTIVFVLGIILCFSMFRMAYKTTDSLKETDRGEPTVKEVLGYGIGSVLCIMLFIEISNLIMSIQKIIIPEYFAIQSLIDMIK